MLDGGGGKGEACLSYWTGELGRCAVDDVTTRLAAVAAATAALMTGVSWWVKSKPFCQ